MYMHNLTVQQTYKVGTILFPFLKWEKPRTDDKAMWPKSYLLIGNGVKGWT